MNKLHSVKPVLGDWQSSYRKDEVVLCHACIGHTYMTHSYIPPQCEHSQCILTVRHILVECNHLARTRNDIFGRCGVVESFQFHPDTNLKYLINQYIFSNWQDDWNGAVMNKLHSVKPVLGDWQSSYRRCRKDEVVLCRARIGHTYMTHSYILKKDPPPQCEHCQCIMTVRKHFGGVQSSHSDKK